MCEIERHCYPCCQQVYEIYKKNASFCQSMDPGKRCEKTFNMHVGKIQQHKEGMCPACIQARAGQYAQQAPISQHSFSAQAQSGIKQEQREMLVHSQDQHELAGRFGGQPGSPTNCHPSSQPADPRRVYDGFTGIDRPQYYAQLAPQLLPQNLAAHTPIPIPQTCPIAPGKAAFDKAVYTPPSFGGQGILAQRPVFEPPKKRVIGTTNGKQGMGTRKTSPTPKLEQKRKRSHLSEDEGDEYEPRSVKTRAQARAQAQTQSLPSRPVSQSFPQSTIQPTNNQRPVRQGHLFYEHASRGSPYGYQKDLFVNPEDLTQPSNSNQLLEIYAQPPQPRQVQESHQTLERYIQPQQTSPTQRTRFQYPEDVSYSAYEGGININNVYCQDNTCYNPPVFGQTYPFVKPWTSYHQPLSSITYNNNNSIDFLDDEQMWHGMDWAKVDEDLANSNAFFVHDAIPQAAGIDAAPTSEELDTPSSNNQRIPMSDRETNTPKQEQHAYSFPGSRLPMPAKNVQDQRTEVARESLQLDDVKPNIGRLNGSMSPLFPED